VCGADAARGGAPGSVTAARQRFASKSPINLAAQADSFAYNTSGRANEGSRVAQRLGQVTIGRGFPPAVVAREGAETVRLPADVLK